ncbi:MAG: LamG-like jellyroll fold domain-containing protein [Gilvibacter sp.]
MEKITLAPRKAVLLTALFFSFFTLGSLGQTQIHQATFESGLDSWTLAGTATHVNNATYAAENNYSIEIAFTDGIMTSPGFALSAYDKIDVAFYMYNRGYDNAETFDLEYRDNPAATWTIVGTMRSANVVSKAADFQQGTPGLDYAKTITLFKTAHTFPILATGEFRFKSNSDQTTDRIYIDYITITGTTFDTSITEGPGGINSNLELWLRADQVNGTGVGTDDTDLTTWQDVGKGNDAGTVIAAQAPRYKNNATDNINFNPVIDFTNDNTTASSDMEYLGTRDEMKGTGGFYSHDIFMVVVPDQAITNTMIPLDTFCSTDPTGNTYNEDVTGFGYGNYTQRFDDEYFAYTIGTTNGVGNGYGKGDKTFGVDLNQVGIINARHNATSSPTGQNVYFNAIDIGDSESDAGDFAAISNTRYWLGRSQYWDGSFGGRIAEVITYSATNTDASSTDDRNRIQSYLAVKYGITLGVNGTSQDYVDGTGTNVIWDQAGSTGFNYDIAGIGRSDGANLLQKQSKSINNNTIITMGVTEIAATNDANSNSISTDETYLMWGNDNGSLAAATPIMVDLSAGTSGLSTMVDFTSISRTWKVVETGGDMPTVQVSVPEISLSATLTPPGSYLMFISSTPSFSPTSEYRIMTLNGANLEADYNFTGTQYITFGYAPQYTFTRSVTFDGVGDYMDAGDVLDLTGDFTMSAWVKRDAGAVSRDIIAKRDNGPYTAGYAMRTNGSGVPTVFWKNNMGFTQQITGTTPLPANEWHQIAIVYDDGDAKLYIDGVQDGPSVPLDAPVGNTEKFLIGAADNGTASFWAGTIDEVRVWNTGLSDDQVRFIMNQEILEHSDGTVTGSIIPQSITDNEVASIDWDANLMAYYPMTTYTFTNVNDESSNGKTAAIKNLDTVDFQTAPLPYESQADGGWDTTGTWLNNAVQDLPRSVSIVDGSQTIDWNIVRTNHDIDVSANTTVLGLMVETNQLDIDNENKLEVTHYLELDGVIDLVGESQLVQGPQGDLDRTSTGYIEKDQGGTADTYTYNYWSSPVSKIGPGFVNRPFVLNNTLKDGSDVTTPLTINWVGGYNGSPGVPGVTPISIAGYWVFKFTNSPIGDYSAWINSGPYDTMTPGEGYTMKGPGSGGVTDVQNYTFRGKPNNDQTSYQIELGVFANNNYLVGNPFPSALDANDFIADNSHLDGALYFWEHWGGGSHVLGEYQGGYATYSLGGGTPAMSHPDVSSTGSGTKTPGRYVAPGQGFFVAADSAGDIEFNNSQRNFVKSGASSVFMFTEEYTATSSAPTTDEDSGFEEPDDTFYEGPDMRTKLRIGFDSPNLMHRQLLLTFDDNTTLGPDHSYDAKVFGEQIHDMNWLIEDNKYVIQSIPTLTSESSVVLPLMVSVSESGEIQVGMDAMENMTEKLVPYFHDKVLDVFIDLREKSYSGIIEEGTYNDRFEIVLRRTPRSRTVSAGEKSGNSVVAVNNKLSETVTLYSKVEEEPIEYVEIFNILGQSVYTQRFNGVSTQEVISSNRFAVGAYIIRTTTTGGTYSTKILIEK